MYFKLISQGMRKTSGLVRPYKLSFLHQINGVLLKLLKKTWKRCTFSSSGQQMRLWEGYEAILPLGKHFQKCLLSAMLLFAQKTWESLALEKGQWVARTT